MNTAMGRRTLRAVRHAARAIRHVHDEQVYMWECLWRISRVTPPAAAGPLRWVPSLDGHRLEGSYLPGPGSNP